MKVDGLDIGVGVHSVLVCGGGLTVVLFFLYHRFAVSWRQVNPFFPFAIPALSRNA